MPSERRINRASQKKGQIRKIVDAEIEVSLITRDKQVPRRERKAESRARVGQKARLALTLKPAQTIAQHQGVIKQVALKRVVKVQLSQVVVQVILRKDEKLGDHPTRQAARKIIIPPLTKILKRPAPKQLPQPLTKTELLTQQQEPPAIPVLPTASL